VAVKLLEMRESETTLLQVDLLFFFFITLKPRVE